MPSRLRSMNPMHHSGSPKLHRNAQGRKKVTLTLAGLASSRRRPFRRSGSSSSTTANAAAAANKGVVGRGLSSRAEKLLDDDDDGDESYRSNAGAAAAPRAAPAAAAPSQARGVASGEAYQHFRGIENSVRRASRFGGVLYGDVEPPSDGGSRGCPDDQSTPRAQPEEIQIFAAENTPESHSEAGRTKTESNQKEKRDKSKDDDDDGPGAEALLFIYGPNPDLRRDVFQLSLDSTPEELEKSYREQTEQLDLAMNSPPQYQKEVAVMCGMTAKHSAFLHPKDFCEIKRDALRHAHGVLKEQERRRRRWLRRQELKQEQLRQEQQRRDQQQQQQRQSQQQLQWQQQWQQHHQQQQRQQQPRQLQQRQQEQPQMQPRQLDGELSNALEEESSVKFFEGFDLDEVAREEEHTVQTMVETDPSEVSCDEQVTGRGFWSEEKCLADLESDDDADDRDQEVECVSDGDKVVLRSSRKEFSYNCKETRDDDKKEGSTRTEEAKDRSSHRKEDGDYVTNGHPYYEHENASHYEGHDNRYGEEDEDYDYAIVRKSYQKQDSPTDPGEFEVLIRDSLPHSAYLNQISPGMSITNENEREEVFDPFDLHYTSFPKAAFAKDYENETPEPPDPEFVCALPKRDEEEDVNRDRDAGDSAGANGNVLLEMPAAEDARAPANDPADGRASRSHRRNASADSLATSQSLGESSRSPGGGPKGGGGGRSRKWRKWRRRRPRPSRVLHALASVSGSRGGSVSNASAAAAAATAEEEVESGDEVHVDSGSIVSRLTDESDGVVDRVEEVEGRDSIDPLDGIEGLDGVDCFDGEEDPRGADENDRPVIVDGGGPQHPTRPIEPDGPNMSKEDGDGEGAVASAAVDDGVEVEIETFRSVAPETYALDSDAESSHQSDDDGDDVEDSDEDGHDADSDDVASDVVQPSVASSLSSSCSGDDTLSECSVKTVDEDEMQQGPLDHHEDDDDDRQEDQGGGEESYLFHAEENPLRVTTKLDTRGDDETESCSTASSRSHDDPNCCDRINCCEDCCAFACIDACIDSVDYCCRIICCQGPEEY